ncbi:MAG: GNAT family N-acetyltransferase, partial [Acidobacteria bacterium]
DVETCGIICYQAFRKIAETHNFRPDFPNAQAAIELHQMLLDGPNIFNVVIEDDGRVIGSNHLAEFGPVSAVGPITVAPDAQGKGIGRLLMQAVLERGEESESVRLVQDAFNTASMSLYASLGFDVKEPLVLIEGVIEDEKASVTTVDILKEEDIESCARLCKDVHGFDRTMELKHIPPFLKSFVARRDGRVVAYATAPNFWALNHAVAETEDDMHQLLIGAARLSDQPLSFLLPTRQSSLFRWCLQKGLQVIKPMTLMAVGKYFEPRGVFLASVGY